MTQQPVFDLPRLHLQMTLQCQYMQANTEGLVCAYRRSRQAVGTDGNSKTIAVPVQYRHLLKRGQR